ncbi:PREDICTED: collagen alpha-1(I) chain-like [Hipposideros armiger]|uniref:Collagen alpha-1(I) chain-like n=1 Tax=Hipposideros armiger TaxID=186990 RepID=A0A8B7T9D6_HIPAR|nr:PREDICTED: collagen alpha-1(I) chain-like [Hipposideros armiger]
MPPLRGYTMGMIRRSLAFPSRARNKAAGGGAEGGGRPLGPRLPVRGPGTEGGSDRSEPAAPARSLASGAAALRPETKYQVPSAAPCHSGGPSGRRRRHPDGVTGRALDPGIRRLDRSRRAPGVGCAEEGAPGRAHRAERGAGRTAPSTPWTGRTITARRPPGSQPLGRHAGLPSAVVFLECPPGHLQTAPATPPPHFIWLSGNPGNVLTSPPRPETPAHSAACRESRPGLGVPRSGSQRAVVADVTGARVGEGGWVSLLPRLASSSGRGGSGASRARPVLGSEGPGCARGAQEVAWPGCGRLRKPLARSLARSAPGAAALAKNPQTSTRSAQPKASDVIRATPLLGERDACFDNREEAER